MSFGLYSKFQEAMRVLSRLSLEGKVVAVTGAGRGIGRTIAWDVFRSGAKLAIGSRTLGELESLVAEIESEGAIASIINWMFRMSTLLEGLLVLLSIAMIGSIRW